MANRGKVSILVVDDEPDLLSMVVEELELQGFTVFCAENNAQAFEILSKQKIDVILSDVRMPGGDGLELFESVRKKYSDQILFLFMTGFSDLTVKEALERGATALIHKPFQLDELVDFVKRNAIC